MTSYRHVAIANTTLNNLCAVVQKSTSTNSERKVDICRDFDFLQNVHI